MLDLGMTTPEPGPLIPHPKFANPDPLAAIIDHTLLRPEATAADITRLCQEAVDYGFGAVCVNGAFVRLVKILLGTHSTRIASVVGFPLGATATPAKVFEARQAIEDGADEIDMVIHIGYLKSKDYKRCHGDIRAVVEAAAPKAVKVILETALLTELEKQAACLISREAGAAYVKNSTGFSKGGATVEDIALMRQTVGPEMGIKASGGIRDRKTAAAMIEAGATRLGTSRSVQIVTAQ